MRALRRVAVVVVTLGVASALAACGDDGGGTAVDAGLDGDPDLVNDCTRTGAVDLTAANADRTVAQVGISYMPACLRIEVGQAVTWTADFVAHPLSSGSPSGGAQAGSPIVETITGSTVTFTFPAAGVFGFWCEEHGRAMMGAVYVEP